MSEDDLLNIIGKIMNSSEASIVNIQYGLTALLKLTYKCKNSFKKIEEIIKRYTNHSNTEIQQRALEYSLILQND